MKVQIYDLKSIVDFSTSIVRKIAHRVLYKTCSYLSVGCTRISDEMRKTRTDGANIYLEKAISDWAIVFPYRNSISG